MKIEKYERIFMMISAFVMALGIFAVVWSTGHGGAHLPKPAGRIKPELVKTTAPFDQPGLRQTGDNTYEAVIIASAWQYTPSEIKVPEGAEVTFIVTSLDVIHGMRIPTTNVNAMIIPGQITKVTATMHEKGVHSIICHEYCGIGHQTMGGTVVVE